MGSNPPGEKPGGLASTWRELAIEPWMLNDINPLYTELNAKINACNKRI